MKHFLEQDRLYHELAQAHGGAIMRLARATEADADKRRDLVQIMNFELWKSLARFDRRCSSKSWVYRIIHNVAASYVDRESRRRSRFVDKDDLEHVPDLDRLHGRLEKQDALAKLHIWIRKLDMPDRQILLLYLEGFRAAEIGDVTGLKSEAIATRISRLKSKLSSNFQENTHDKP